jgi:hypothetical protein
VSDAADRRPADEAANVSHGTHLFRANAAGRLFLADMYYFQTIMVQ